MFTIINPSKLFLKSLFCKKKTSFIDGNNRSIENTKGIFKNEKLERITVEVLNNNQSIVIGKALHESKLKNVEVDSKIRILYFRLRKNLETLNYLSELESQMNDASSFSKIYKQYDDIKKSIQLDTINISKKLSYYKALKQSVCD